jgi:hypothetical protein
MEGGQVFEEGRVRTTSAGLSRFLSRMVPSSIIVMEVGATLRGSADSWYRCRIAFSGPKDDRRLSRYVRADVLEVAVKAAVADVPEAARG